MAKRVTAHPAGLRPERGHHVQPFVLVRLLAEWTPPFPGFFLYYASRRQMRPVLTASPAALREGRT